MTELLEQRSAHLERRNIKSVLEIEIALAKGYETQINKRASPIIRVQNTQSCDRKLKKEIFKNKNKK